MKKFRFKLEKVLNLRADKQRNLEIDLAKIDNEIIVKNKILLELEQKQYYLFNEISSDLTRDLYMAYVVKLNKQIEQTKLQLLQLKDDRNKVQFLLAQAWQDAEVLRKLKQRSLDEFISKVNKLEQEQLDEFTFQRLNLTTTKK
jgi:flagellar protein FliJ